MRWTVRIALVLVLVGAGCAIQPDAAPQEIPFAERVPLDPVDPQAGVAVGSSRIFLLTSDEEGGERQLRSVLRGVDPTATAVLEELLRSPNQEELETGLRTALPEGLVLLPPTRTVAGTLIVDVSAEILELPGSEVRLAVAQIVFTANELEGVRGVRLRVEGEQRGWPDGRGELQDRPLTVYDFAGYAETTQPTYPAVPSQPAA